MCFHSAERIAGGIWDMPRGFHRIEEGGTLDQCLAQTSSTNIQHTIRHGDIAQSPSSSIHHHVVILVETLARSIRYLFRTSTRQT